MLYVLCNVVLTIKQAIKRVTKKVIRDSTYIIPTVFTEKNSDLTKA